ncbi:hypothetical protein B0H19DRAFT_476220 [Mycena capillaripes]|nr:hypothetical protein B0H19DRAFT_476220 [Mycena capillaripes]
MSLTNVVFGQLFGPAAYNSVWSTQLSISLNVGHILGQLTIGYICDVKGRKWGIVLSTALESSSVQQLTGRTAPSTGSSGCLRSRVE